MLEKIKKTLPAVFLTVILCALSLPAIASEVASDSNVHKAIPPLHPGALFCIFVFIVAYINVLLEEKLNLRKSKPVMVGAAVIWITIALIAGDYGYSKHDLHTAIYHGLDEYAALMLFLLAAMTFITTMENRNIFEVLRVKLIQARFNMRQMFWATGILAFFLSPIADNLTTALVLGAVIMAVGKHDPKFVALACVNVVVAANSGGAFSPFGDITTLMVWQAGHVEFFEFFSLFIPAAVNFLIPAFIMSFFIPKDFPDAIAEDIHIKRGGRRVVMIGILTIATAVTFEQYFGLPAFLGMMTGLSFLMMLAYYIRLTSGKEDDNDDEHFHVLDLIKSAEWDTLLFFYGVIFCVNGLAFLGYMELASGAMYETIGATYTNVTLGVVSAVVDNIPVMFGVLSMNPDMDHFQWLLVTLTAGVGGSMLSVGSAAGVALMGVAHGKYTFMSHMKWAPVIILGYAAAIGAHFLVNSHYIGDAPASAAHQVEALVKDAATKH